MKVVIVNNCAVKGQHLAAGSTHDLADEDADALLAMKKAVKADSNRSIGLEKSETKPKKRKKE
jgi:hypothetical protein